MKSILKNRVELPQRKVRLQSGYVGDLHIIKAVPVGNAKPWPIICTHGMCCAGDWVWWNWIIALAEAGFIAYAPTLRGHGESRPVKHFGATDLDDYVEDIETVVEHVCRVHDAEKCILLGHSMGSLVNMHFAVRNSNRVVGGVYLTSAPPTGVFVTGPVLLRIWRYLSPMFRSKALKLTKKDLAELMLNCMHEAHQVDILRKFGHDAGKAVREIAFPLKPLGGKVPGPSIVIGCTSDRMTPAPMQKRIARKIGAEYAEFGGDHMITLHPDYTRRLAYIIQWISEHVGH